MGISSVNSNPYLLDQIKFALAQNKIDREKGSDPQKNFTFYEKNTSKDQQNKVVSEKNIDQASLAEYNLRLKQNVPLLKAETPKKTFNESKKNPNIIVQDNETGAPVDFTEIIGEETANAKDTGKGYYINPDSQKNNSMWKRYKGAKELFQEKINNVYNVGFKREPGTLVNLVF